MLWLVELVGECVIRSSSQRVPRSRQRRRRCCPDETTGERGRETRSGDALSRASRNAFFGYISSPCASVVHPSPFPNTFFPDRRFPGLQWSLRSLYSMTKLVSDAKDTLAARRPNSTTAHVHRSRRAHLPMARRHQRTGTKTREINRRNANLSTDIQRNECYVQRKYSTEQHAGTVRTCRHAADVTQLAGGTTITSAAQYFVQNARVRRTIHRARPDMDR
jgi:hypothetical protein